MTQRKKIKAGMAIFSKNNIETIADFVSMGKLKPVIDKTFQLEEIAEAHRYVDMGHKVGSVVINIEKV